MTFCEGIPPLRASNAGNLPCPDFLLTQPQWVPYNWIQAWLPPDTTTVSALSLDTGLTSSWHNHCECPIIGYRPDFLLTQPLWAPYHWIQAWLPPDTTTVSALSLDTGLTSSWHNHCGRPIIGYRPDFLLTQPLCVPYHWIQAWLPPDTTTVGTLSLDTGLTSWHNHCGHPIIVYRPDLLTQPLCAPYHWIQAWLPPDTTTVCALSLDTGLTSWHNHCVGPIIGYRPDFLLTQPLCSPYHCIQTWPPDTTTVCALSLDTGLTSSWHNHCVRPIIGYRPDLLTQPLCAPYHWIQAWLPPDTTTVGALSLDTGLTSSWHNHCGCPIIGYRPDLLTQPLRVPYHWIHHMACHRFGTKPSPKAMLPDCQINPQEHISMHFYLDWNTFRPQKYFWESFLLLKGYIVENPYNTFGGVNDLWSCYNDKNCMIMLFQSRLWYSTNTSIGHHTQQILPISVVTVLWSLAHGPLLMHLMGKWPWHCTFAGQDDSSKHDLEWISPLVAALHHPKGAGAYHLAPGLPRWAWRESSQDDWISLIWSGWTRYM